jgi:hypothetical protein
MGREGIFCSVNSERSPILDAEFQATTIRRSPEKPAQNPLKPMK